MMRQHASMLPGRRCARLAVIFLAVIATGLAQGSPTRTAVAATDAAMAPDAAHELVANTAEALLALIRESQTYVETDPRRFIEEVDSLLAPVLDFQGFARRVMATHFRRATPAQRQRFTRTFREGLLTAYALSLAEFADGEVRLLPPARAPSNPRRRNVRMEIRHGSTTVQVDYLLAQYPDGVWRVGNLIVAGVNLGLTFRSQFQSLAADHRYGGDLDQIINAWEQFVTSRSARAPGPSDAT